MNIIAVVVAYAPDATFGARLAAIAAQTSSIIVVDNSEEHRAQNAVAEAARANPNTTYLVNANVGKLAHAQNLGIQEALARGAQWVALFDDDSMPQEGMVAALLAAYEAHPEKQSIGLLAPTLVDEASGTAHAFITMRGPLPFRVRLSKGETNAYLLTANASGSLIRAEAIRKCGLMREDFAMDWLDIEYSLRLRERGFALLAVGGAHLSHNLGAKTKRLGITTSNHAAARRYSITRNRVATWKRYATSTPGYIAYDMLVLCYELAKIMVFESNKRIKLNASMRGAIAGVRGDFSKNN